MKKFLLVCTIASLYYCSGALTKTELKDLKKSIFKIAVINPDEAYVATAFVVEHNKEKVLVTNNHVCDGFYKAEKVVLIESQTIDTLPQSQQALDLLDNVTNYYMEYGTDICIIKSKNVNSYKPLELNQKNAEPTNSILIAGFVGRSFDLMYVDGKVYGTISIYFPKKLVKCGSTNFNINNSGELTCSIFDKYPIHVRKTLQTATSNVGLGFSGSPVLKNGKVVGIVSQFFQPSQNYSNGDTIYFPVSEIKKALKNSDNKMISLKNKKYVNFIKISEADRMFNDFLMRFGIELELLREKIRKEIKEKE